MIIHNYPQYDGLLRVYPIFKDAHFIIHPPALAPTECRFAKPVGSGRAVKGALTALIGVDPRVANWL